MKQVAATWRPEYAGSAVPMGRWLHTSWSNSFLYGMCDRSGTRVQPVTGRIVRGVTRTCLGALDVSEHRHCTAAAEGRNPRQHIQTRLPELLSLPWDACLAASAGTVRAAPEHAGSRTLDSPTQGCVVKQYTAETPIRRLKHYSFVGRFPPGARGSTRSSGVCSLTSTVELAWLHHDPMPDGGVPSQATYI